MSDRLIQSLKKYEGVVPTAYRDHLGYWTIGIGFCIDDRVAGAGLLPNEIDYILNNRINEVRLRLQNYDFFNDLDNVRQETVIRMAFNLGIGGLFKFKNMIASLVDKDWENAVYHAKDSLWATQIQPSRLEDICYCLLHGKYKDE